MCEARLRRALDAFWIDYEQVPLRVNPGAGNKLHHILCVAKHAARFGTSEALVASTDDMERSFRTATHSFLRHIGVPEDSLDFEINGITMDALGNPVPTGDVMFKNTLYTFDSKSGELVLSSRQLYGYAWSENP